MEHQRDNTPRQTWAEAVADRQEKVNATLAELQPEIDRMNMTLAQYCSEGSEHTMDYLRNAVTYLDGQWGYMGHSFVVTGSWNGPVVQYEPEGQSFSFSYQHQEAFSAVESHGFYGYQLNSQPPRIGLLFQSEPREISMPLIGGVLFERYVADPSEVTLQYVHSEVEGVEKTDIVTVGERLGQADSFLHSYLNDKDSNFYALSAHEQYSEISSLVQTVNDVLPLPGSGEFLLTEVEASMVYMQHQRGERLAPMSLKRKKIELTGRVEGVTTYDLVAHASGDKQFLEPQHCETAKYGLMLVVSDYSSNMAQPEAERGIIFVPLRCTSNIDLSVEKE